MASLLCFDEIYHKTSKNYGNTYHMGLIKQCVPSFIKINSNEFNITSWGFHQIYDNACNALEVIANREPNYLKSGRLVVDRLHIKNHRNCSRSSNSDLYPDLKGVNTQRCEQVSL